jgi:hypothetical protein
MLGAIESREIDYVPCSFMLFWNVSQSCESQEESVEKQLQLGLDPYLTTGPKRCLHPDVEYREWTETREGHKLFCRSFDTPRGPLTGAVRQIDGWPSEGHLPLFHDFIVPRIAEPLVKPEQDLEKLPYLFGPFSDGAVADFREDARRARATAEKHGLLLTGGFAYDGYEGLVGAEAMSWLTGFTETMILSITRPELIKEYANIIHEWNLRQIGLILDIAKPDLLIRRAWYETTEFWTPAAFRQIIAPTIREEVDLVHQAGKKYGYLITSAFLPILEDILDAGIDVLIGLDPKEGKGTDIAVVKEHFRARGKAIWGGTSGSVTVEMGTEKENEHAVIEALTVLGKGGGFILSPVDNVRENDERTWRNTYAYIDTWKRYRTLYS